MANQTVTADATLEEVIAGGLNNGQNITINSGATVTMTQTNSVLIGRLTVNDGKLIMDGENISSGNSMSLIGEGGDSSVDETLVVAGQGTFEVKGAWFDIGTTDGTDNQVIDMSTATGSALWADDELISWLAMIQIETGRRINYTNGSGVNPKVGDWIRLSSNKLSSFGKIKEVGTGYVIVWAWYGDVITDTAELQIRSVVDNNGPDLQKSWTATANGTDVKEVGVYTEWGNCRSNNTSYIAGFHHGVGGMIFDHAMFSTSLTLGSSVGDVGGFVPPSGCNIRVPNCMIGSATSADFDAGNCTDVGTSAETDWYQLECSAGGVIDWNILNCGNFFTVDTQASAYDCSYVGASLGLGSNIAGGKTTFNHCVVVSDPQNLSVASLRNAFSVTDNVLGADLNFCMFVCSHTMKTPVGGETSLGVTVRDCISTQSGQATSQTNGTYGYLFTKCNEVTFDNNVAIGNDHASQGHQLYVVTTTNFTGTNFQFSATQSETQQTQEKDVMNITTFSSNFSMIGIEVIGEGMPGNNMCSFNDTNFGKIRAVGMIDDKMNFQDSDAEYMISITGLCNDLDFARMWKDTSGTITEEFIIAPTTCKNILVQNCSGKYASELQPSGGDNIRFKGVHGGSGTFGGATGWEDAYVGSYGNSFHDGFQSDTNGSIACLMITPSATTNETTVVAGNPKFFKDGDLDVADGDTIIFEQGYYAKGHTGFTGNFTTAIATAGYHADEWGSNRALDFQYQLEGGSWNGTWLDLRTPANLTGISGDIEAGIRFKIRLTTTGTKTSMSGILIDTTTSLQAQKDNMYPIDQFEATLTLTGLKDGSDVVILQAGTDTVLKDVDQGGSTFNYTYSTLQDIDIGVIKQGYITNYQYGYTLGSTDASLPITQLIDRAYQ